MNVESIIKIMIIRKHEHSNGLHSIFASYGIYPEYKDFFVLCIFFNNQQFQSECMTLLQEYFEIVQDKYNKVRKKLNITDESIIRRVFVPAL